MHDPRGSITGWWPYPFMDVGIHGWGRVLANLAGVAVLFGVVGLVFVALDGRLGRRTSSST